jgi:uncharacterized integral membrane protein
MQRTLLFLLVFTVLIAVFALQNSGEVEIKLWFWSVQISLVLVLILAFAFGALAGILFSLPGWSHRPSRRKTEQQERTYNESDKMHESGRKNGSGPGGKAGGDPEFEDVQD